MITKKKNKNKKKTQKYGKKKLTPQKNVINCQQEKLKTPTYKIQKKGVQVLITQRGHINNNIAKRSNRNMNKKTFNVIVWRETTTTIRRAITIMWWIAITIWREPITTMQKESTTTQRKPVATSQMWKKVTITTTQKKLIATWKELIKTTQKEGIIAWKEARRQKTK